MLTTKKIPATPAVDNRWIEDVRKFRKEGGWLTMMEKFHLAVLRTLRLQHKDMTWLSNELGMSIAQLNDLLKAKKEITLKQLVAIQEVLNEEIIVVKDMDLV